MSLHDVDKVNQDRSVPKPNQSDQLIDGAIKNHGTTSIHPITESTPNNSGFLQTKNARILANDGTTNRALFGYNQALNLWGFFLTKLGIDVNTNTDPSQFIFNSNQDIFKIVASGIATIPTSGSATSTVSVAHGLGYIPAFVAFVLVAGNYNTVPLNNYNTSTGALISAYLGWSDATNINFQTVVPGGTVSSSTPVKYYLLQETAN